jgi:hypothetical protein
MATLPTLPASPFHRAAQRGDLAELQRLLAAGADVHSYAHSPSWGTCGGAAEYAVTTAEPFLPTRVIKG